MYYSIIVYSVVHGPLSMWHQFCYFDLEYSRATWCQDDHYLGRSICYTTDCLSWLHRLVWVLFTKHQKALLRFKEKVDRKEVEEQKEQLQKSWRSTPGKTDTLHYVRWRGGAWPRNEFSDDLWILVSCSVPSGHALGNALVWPGVFLQRGDIMERGAYKEHGLEQSWNTD